MKNKKRWSIIYGLLFLCMAVLCVVKPVMAGTVEATIYGLSSSDIDKITIPQNVAQSYQIPVTGSGVTYKISSGSSAKVSATGVVTPRYTYWKSQGNYSISVSEGEEYDYYTLNKGDTTIVAKSGDTSYTYTIHVIDYLTIYCDKVMEDYIASNITEGMTDLEKVTAICKFPASYDYSPYYSSASSMIVNGGGDCWASTDAIIKLSEKLGIKAWSRNGNKDLGAGSGHMNAMVELNGVYYELDAGYSGVKGANGYRYYSVKERTSLFSYYTSSAGLRIYQYDGSDTTSELVVPQTIDGKTVVEICDSAFSSAKFTKITLPDTITRIGDFAFTTCTNMTSCNIPASVTVLGAGPFTNCTSLTNITIDSGNTNYKIIDQAIYTKDGTTLVNCPNAKSITIPDTVTTIADYAIYYNNKLENLTIPASVTTIGEGGVSTCASLKRITIEGEGLKEIGNHGFRSNTSLLSITLPASLKSIGAYGFASCSKLETIIFKGDAPTFGATIDGTYYDYVFRSCTANAYYPDGNATWKGDAVGNHGGTITWAVSSKAPDMEDGKTDDSSESGTTGGTNTEDSTVNDTDTPVVKEYYNAKTGMTIAVVEGQKTATLISIKKSKVKGKITIPNTMKMEGVTYTITTIGKNAFKGNKKITSVKLGNKIKVIEAGAFSGCTKLKSVTLGKNVTTIGDKAFYKCKALAKITIPSKISKIGKQAFAGCSKLKNITIKTKKLTTKNVGKNAFKGIHSKATIKVPGKKIKAYKSLLKKKGVGKKAKIKK